ncbi:flagellin [Salinibacillus kushneri]|uniref:Flagellin n=1 Tax=Salinibacillus kushneri TaxID=237682 RepID=A0A1H9YSN5_9BACI|nr:flagellin [Salinibacillus kushneri]SES71669.1 flagellin [Salinibacillus kushneri]
MRINHNIAALNTYRQLGAANNSQQSSMEKLSSGLRINNASDDAAGLAISEKMRGQIRGLDQAQTNAQDGISMIQTAEGALNETHSILQRMRELATQASNDTNTETDRGEIQKEINQLTSEINRIGNTTEFNTQSLLDGGEDSENQLEAVQGEFTFDVSSLSSGDSFEINGIEFTQTSGGSASNGFADADALKSAINGTALSNEYTASVSGDEITLTQVSGEESSTSPQLSGDITNSDLSTETEGHGPAFGATFQVGANEGQSMSIQIGDMRASALGLSGDADQGNFTSSNNVTDGTDNQNVEAALDVSTHEKASQAITAINDAIEKVSAQRSDLGAYQNRLDHTINNLGTSSENLTAAESRIRDVDMAKEMMNQTKSSILSQASQSMLAQANQMPQGVLQLLQ